jgi:2-methylisocitrate lyase-like PEP mutase family enzyme
VLGMPDAGLITMTEMVANAKYINDAIAVPVVADCDTGFGNAINTRRSVAEFIRAGVAGIHIEDQVMPKRCGHVAGKSLVTLEEAVGKIRIAADTRAELDPSFLLIARTDARSVNTGGVEEAIRRGRAYVQAGADAVFVEAPQTEDEIKRICDEIDAPIFYNCGGDSPRISLQRLGELGVSMVITPGATMRVTAAAVYDFALGLKNHGLAFEEEWRTDFERNHPLGNFHAFAGFPLIRQLEEKYLPAEEREKYKGALGFQP